MFSHVLTRSHMFSELLLNPAGHSGVKLRTGGGGRDHSHLIRCNHGDGQDEGSGGALRSSGRSTRRSRGRSSAVRTDAASVDPQQ